MLPFTKVDSRTALLHRGGQRYLARVASFRRAAMAKYFVTGATGFIGGRVTRQLVDAGQEVVAIARNPERAKDLVSLGVDVRPGDITDPDSLRRPMAGVDGVFHIAGWYKIGSKDRAEGERINVAGTRNVLTAMRDLGIRKGVYTSTLAVSSDTHGELVDETYRSEGPSLAESGRTEGGAADVRA